MFSLQKSKAVTVIGLLSILSGVLLVIEWIFQIPLLQTLLPVNAPRLLIIGLGWIILGVVLLIAQFQLRKCNTAMETLNMQLEKTLQQSSSERHSLLKKLRNCNGNYQSIIAESFDAIYVLDFDGNFIETNSSMCEMTGYTRQELLKLNIRDIIDPEQLKTNPVIPFRNNYEQAVIKERRLVRKNGKVFDVEVKIKKFAENRVFVIAEDITRLKQLEIELYDAKLKFRTLGENSTVGVYIAQKEKIIYANARFAEIFGYKPYELVNNPTSFVDIIIDEDCRAIVRKNMFARYSGEIDFINYEVTGKKKDGTPNHVEFSGGRAVMDGEPTIIGTMIDITKRWKNEEVLKQYEANLQTIMETTDVAYALLDKNLKVTAFNQMAAQFVKDNYNHTLIPGDQLRDYFPAERLPQFIDSVDEVLKGNNINYEIDYPQPDGSILWYYVRMFPITNSAKEIFGLMLALSNITERKIAEDSLHAAYKKIQNQINSIKEMAWKQSHLIRSPLANLKGLISLLKDEPSDKEILKNTLAELERLDNIIIDLADDASNHDL